MFLICIRLKISAIEFTDSDCDVRWTNWGECSHDCGGSNRTRYAYCKDDIVYDYVMTETVDCSYVPCPGNSACKEYLSIISS